MPPAGKPSRRSIAINLRFVGHSAFELTDGSDVALVPIGGHYTMGRHDAVTAVEWIGVRAVVPCHYNTFPPVETDAHAFADDVQKNSGTPVHVLDPGQAIDL